MEMDDMFLYERVDLDALQIIRDNYDALYDRLGRFVDPKKGYSVVTDKKIVYEMLNEFLKNKRKSEKQVYKFASGIKWGRMFSRDTSLQGISRVIRQTISKGIYWDIDIVNAHPTILYRYCVDNNLRVPTLKKYIDNRDEMLADLIGLFDTKTKKALTRDEAKTIPLAIINGANREGWFPDGETPSWVSLLEYEVKDIFNHFKQTPKGKKFYKRAYDKKATDRKVKKNSTLSCACEKNVDGSVAIHCACGKNVEGSTLNYFLCEQENEILGEMVEYLRSRGINIGVYCFDGVMVYKKPDEMAFPETILRGMEEQVKDTLGYTLKIVCKPMTEFISLDGYEKREERVFKMTHLACAETYYDTMGPDKFVFTKQSGWYINRSAGDYAKTSVEEKLLINIQKTLIPVMAKMCSEINENVDAKEAQRNTKLLDFLESQGWIENVERALRQKYYKDEVFEPNTTRVTDDTFNLFNGFASDKPPMEYLIEYITPFVEHIEYICGDSAKYVMDWISQLIQKPWEKIGTSIVITSRFQGNGKDTIAEMIKALIGAQYATKPDNLGDALFGRFNGNLRNKFFCHLPEVKGSDIKPYWNRFKEYIISEKDGTQEKGLERQETKSYVRYFITSNDDNPVPIEPSDRRFNYINSQSEPKEKQYYERLYDLLHNEEAMRCLHKFFSERDISTVDWKKDRVQSALVSDLKLSNTPLTTMFLGELLENSTDFIDSKNRMTADALWTAFLSYCSKSNITLKMGKIAFCMAMSKNAVRYGMTKKLFEIDKKTANGYIFDLKTMEAELIRDGVLSQEDQDERRRISLLRNTESI